MRGATPARRGEKEPAARAKTARYPMVCLLWGRPGILRARAAAGDPQKARKIHRYCQQASQLIGRVRGDCLAWSKATDQAPQSSTSSEPPSGGSVRSMPLISFTRSRNHTAKCEESCAQTS